MQNQELQQEFLNFLQEKKDKAKQELARIENIINDVRAPQVLEQPKIESKSTQPVIPAQSNTKRDQKLFVMHAITREIKKMKSFLNVKNIVKNINSKHDNSNHVTEAEVMSVIFTNIKSAQPTFIRVMSNHYTYIIGLNPMPVPYLSQILYCPDANDRGRMFYHVRRACMDVAIKLDRPFSMDEMRNEVGKDFGFLKNNHQKRLRASISKALSQLCAPLKPGARPILETTGDGNDKIFSLL